MSEKLISDLVGRQIGTIKGIIREVRILIGSLESLAEDKVGSFRPLLCLAKRSFEELADTGLLKAEDVLPIREELDSLQEEVDDFEHSNVFAGLSGPVLR